MSREAQAGFAIHLAGGASSGRSGSSQNGTHAAGRRAPLSRTDAFDDHHDDNEEGSAACTSRRRPLQHKLRPGGQGDEAVTGFSRDGAEYGGGRASHRERSRAVPVIPKQADADWMEERKRRLGLDRFRQELGSLTSMRRTDAASASSTAAAPSAGFGATETNGHSGIDRIGDDEERAGLQIRSHRQQRDSGEMETDGAPEPAARARAARDATPSLSEAGQSPPHTNRRAEASEPPADEEAAARAALLSGSRHGLGSDGTAPSQVVVPLSEDEALRRDAETRPEAPTMDDYARMPVEDFGAALLRGMGWKEGMGAGKQRQGPTGAPEIKRRAALLGLGAKERPRNDDAGTSNEGGSSVSRRQPSKQTQQPHRPERRYVPVVRREREREQRDSDGPMSRNGSGVGVGEGSLGSSHDRTPPRRRSWSPPLRRREARDEEEDEETKRKRRQRRRDKEDQERYRGGSSTSRAAPEAQDTHRSRHNSIRHSGRERGAYDDTDRNREHRWRERPRESSRGDPYSSHHRDRAR